MAIANRYERWRFIRDRQWLEWVRRHDGENDDTSTCKLRQQASRYGWWCTIKSVFTMTSEQTKKDVDWIACSVEGSCVYGKL